MRAGQLAYPPASSTWTSLCVPATVILLLPFVKCLAVYGARSILLHYNP